KTIATPSGGITPTDTRPLAAAKPNKGKSRFVLAVLAAVAIIAGFAWLAKKIPTSNVVLNDNLVVVLPFRVSGGEQLDYLGEGVVDLFQGTLTGEGGPRAVSSQSAIGAWKRRGGSADNDLIEEEALALARSLGAGLLLQGSVVGSPNNIILNASILAVDGSGEPIHATVSGNIDSVAVLTGRLTAQLISLQAGEESQTASNLTGISLPALREYLQGQIAFREGRFEDALTGYGRALAVDSTFALAALGHSISASWVVTAPNSPGIRIAWENQEQLSPRDKLLLEAWAPPPGAVRSIAETIAINERVAVTLQDRHEAWYLLGDRIFHLGQSVGMSHDQQFDRAWGAFQQALNLAPNFGPILKHKFDYAFWEEDTEYLLALADSFPEFVASTPDVALAIALATNDSTAVHQWMEEIPQHSINDLAVSTMKLFRAGWEDETFQIFDRAASRPTSTANRRGGLGYKWDLLTMAGRPQAAATLRDEMRTEFGPPPPYVLGFTLKNALFMNGDTVQAIQALNELEQHNSGAIAQEEYAVIDQAVAACYSGTWYAARQQTDEALHMRARLREISDRFQDAFVNDYAVPCLMQLDLLLADPADLPEILQAADSVSLTGGPFEGIDLNLFNVLLARAFELQGMPERALAVSRRRLATGGPEQQMMLLYEGRLSAQTGDTLGAIRAYDLYLRVRDGAEPEVRAMDDAVRADLARLVGERPGPR
ncbi:MAG: hypothetical protein OEZ54_10880, partial [Gemmatimonadota bacterium]|nr:hypothetical protein [Gemmatimonadota bacterium]